MIIKYFFNIMLKKIKAKLLLLHVFLICFMQLPSFAEDLTKEVSVAVVNQINTPSLTDPRTSYTSIISITNISSSILVEPMTMTLKGLSPEIKAIMLGGKSDSNGDSFVRIKLPNGILMPKSTINLKLNFAAEGNVLFSFDPVVSGDIFKNTESGTVTVSAYSFSGDNDNPIGASLPAGAKIKVNGISRAFTDGSGKATFLTKTGFNMISAEYSDSAGINGAEVVYGEKNVVSLVVSEGKEIFEDTTLELGFLDHEMLPRTFSQFNLGFYDNFNQSVKNIDLTRVELFDSDDNSISDVTEYFRWNASAATIECININAIKELLAKYTGKIAIFVSAESPTGTHGGSLSFYLSDSKISGQLIAPPSYPDFSLAGIRLRAKINQTDIVLIAITDKNGKFSFPDVPNGVVYIEGESLQNNIYYYATSSILVKENLSIAIPVLSANDLLNFQKNCAKIENKQDFSNPSASAVSVEKKNKFSVGNYSIKKQIK